MCGTDSSILRQTLYPMLASFSHSSCHLSRYQRRSDRVSTHIISQTSQLVSRPYRPGAFGATRTPARWAGLWNICTFSARNLADSKRNIRKVRPPTALGRFVRTERRTPIHKPKAKQIAPERFFIPDAPPRPAHTLYSIHIRQTLLGQSIDTSSSAEGATFHSPGQRPGSRATHICLRPVGTRYHFEPLAEPRLANTPYLLPTPHATSRHRPSYSLQIPAHH